MVKLEAIPSNIEYKCKHCCWAKEIREIVYGKLVTKDIEYKCFINRVADRCNKQGLKH